MLLLVKGQKHLTILAKNVYHRYFRESKTCFSYVPTTKIKFCFLSLFFFFFFLNEWMNEFCSTMPLFIDYEARTKFIFNAFLLRVPPWNFSLGNKKVILYLMCLLIAFGWISVVHIKGSALVKEFLVIS